MLRLCLHAWVGIKVAVVDPTFGKGEGEGEGAGAGLFSPVGVALLARERCIYTYTHMHGKLELTTRMHTHIRTSRCSAPREVERRVLQPRTAPVCQCLLG